LDERQERTVRLLLVGNGSCLGALVRRPLAVEMDEGEKFVGPVGGRPFLVQ
jgi:hypothetical protein